MSWMHGLGVALRVLTQIPHVLLHKIPKVRLWWYLTTCYFINGVLRLQSWDFASILGGRGVLLIHNEAVGLEHPYMDLANPCNLSQWEQPLEGWDLPPHTRSQVLSPKNNMDAWLGSCALRVSTQIPHVLLHKIPQVRLQWYLTISYFVNGVLRLQSWDFASMLGGRGGVANS